MYVEMVVSPSYQLPTDGSVEQEPMWLKYGKVPVLPRYLRGCAQNMGRSVPRKDIMKHEKTAWFRMVFWGKSREFKSGLDPLKVKPCLLPLVIHPTKFDKLKVAERP